MVQLRFFVILLHFSDLYRDYDYVYHFYTRNIPVSRNDSTRRSWIVQSSPSRILSSSFRVIHRETTIATQILFAIAFTDNAVGLCVYVFLIYRDVGIAERISRRHNCVRARLWSRFLIDFFIGFNRVTQCRSPSHGSRTHPQNLHKGYHVSRPELARPA